MSIRTTASKGAKPRKVIRAHLTTHVAILAVGTKTTKPSIIKGTISNFVFRFEMEERALIVAALTKGDEKVARGHFCQIVFMKEFTLIILLTKTPQPMLANHQLFSPHVFERAAIAFHTGTLLKEFTWL
jgi:hypothetical protein